MTPQRHPELVSGSHRNDKEMLKQVQHDKINYMIKQNLSRAQLAKMAAIAGAIAVRSVNPSKKVVQKGRAGDFATIADYKSEKVIMDLIRKNFPKDAILSEETTSKLKDPLKEASLWIIDPVDGTNNLLYGRKYCAVSVAYAEYGVVKAAAVADIFLGDIYTAQKGEGAFFNGKKTRVSGRNKLDEAMIGTDSGYDWETTKLNVEMLLKISPLPKVFMRGASVLEVCDIARGGIDAFFHRESMPWDNAAAMLVVTEAGGVFKDYIGKEGTFMTPDFIAGNKQLVEKMIIAFNKHSTSLRGTK